ncbi:MAG: DegT/DnrJ/EryC1/StrS family aminotransferase [Rhodospirillaceae bacterium]
MRDTASTPMPFIDLQAQRARISDLIDDGIAKVLDHGAFVMGPEIEQLETALAERLPIAHCLCCSSGTDALMISLMAADIGPGDAVFVPSFTFTSTAEVPALLGAHPVFVDIDPDTFNMDPESLLLAISAAKKSGLRPQAVIAVDLFGQPANYGKILPIADAESLWVLSDSAQSFGAMYEGSAVGTLGRVTTTSFYPSKPLGCYGDGGAVFTDDADLYSRMVQVRVHGNTGDKGKVSRIGLTARLDSIQAAILLAKLTLFDEECALRNDVADRYSAGLKDAVITPKVIDGASSVWAHYTVRSPLRDNIIKTLGAEGIPTALFYPNPIHVQVPYRKFLLNNCSLSVTEEIASQVVSLPMHPYLDEDTQDRIIAAVRAAVRA